MANKSIAHNDTGIVGVQGPYIRIRWRRRKTGYAQLTEHYFQATWQAGGQKRKAQFSINHYGYEEALSRAITARQEHEQ